jgi:hypothetical protein
LPELGCHGDSIEPSRPYEEQGVAIWDLTTNKRLLSITTGLSFGRPLIAVTADGLHAYVGGAYNQ